MCRCYLFTDSNSGLLLADRVFASHSRLIICTHCRKCFTAVNFLSLVWLRTLLMTLTFTFDLDWVYMNYRAKYLLEGHFVRKLLSRQTDKQTDTYSVHYSILPTRIDCTVRTALIQQCETTARPAMDTNTPSDMRSHPPPTKDVADMKQSACKCVASLGNGKTRRLLSHMCCPIL